MFSKIGDTKRISTLPFYPFPDDTTACPISTEETFLATAVNIYSWLLVFPFRIVYNPEKEAFRCATSRLRKACCIIMHVTVLTCVALSVYPNLQMFVRAKRSVTVLFHLTYLTGLVVSTIMILKTAWFDVRHVVDLCNITWIQRPDVKPRRLKIYQALMVVWCLGVFVLHIIQGIFSPEKIADAEKAYNLTVDIFSPVVNNLGFNPIAWIRALFGDSFNDSVDLPVFSFYYAYTHLPLTMYLAILLNMQHFVSAGLKRSLLKDTIENPENVLAEYKIVKRAMSKLREAFSGFILSYYILGLSYYSRLPQLFLNPGTDLIDNVVMYLHLGLIALSLYIAMRINVQVLGCMGKYIEVRHQQLDLENISDFSLSSQRLELIALSQELETASVGISCSMFTINKSFIRSTLGIVATYGLVIVQMGGT